jgi:hypothetical protein
MSGGMEHRGEMERRRYHVHTTMPETIVDDLRDQGLQLVGLSVGPGDAYGLYVVECIACGAGVLLDAVEAAWGLARIIHRDIRVLLSVLCEQYRDRGA